MKTNRFTCYDTPPSAAAGIPGTSSPSRRFGASTSLAAIALAGASFLTIQPAAAQSIINVTAGNSGGLNIFSASVAFGNTQLHVYDGGSTTLNDGGVVYLGYAGTGSGLGVTSGGAGPTTITATSPATVTVKAGVSGAQLLLGAGNSGNMSFTGAQSLLNDAAITAVGFQTTSTLSLAQGATASLTAALLIGYGSSNTAAGTVGNGTVTVDASTLTSTDQLQVGRNSGTGTLSVTDGGTASFGGAVTLGGFNATNDTGSVGIVTVDGAGSSLTASGMLTVGNYGTGTLTLSNDSTASVAATTIAAIAGSTGTINFGAAAGSTAVAPGTLLTTPAPTIAFGAGNGLIEFNHTDTSGSYVFPAAITGGNTGETLPSTVQLDSGTTTFTGLSTYTGAMNVNSGAVANAGVANTFSPNAAVNVARNATLNLNGFSQATGAVTNYSVINFDAATPAGRTTLTVNGNYIGGGTIDMSGTLNGGPNDTLIVTGNTSVGTTTIHYTALPESVGATTTGDGILVVQSTGTIDGAFVLDKTPLLVGSAQYTLVRGTTPSNTDNWYLKGYASPQGDTGGGGGVAAVPMSSRWALALLALALAALAMRRQRAR